MGPRVLVTRPRAESTTTARRLVELGFSPVELPLSEIVPIPLEVSALPKSFGAVAVTSANAISHASPAVLAALVGKPCFAVGAKTAAKAREAGFADVAEGSGDAASLARLIVERLDPGASIVFLCGSVRLSELESLLDAARLSVTAMETYDSRPVDYHPETLAGIVAGEPIHAVLLYSAKAAEHFSGLAWSQAARQSFQGARILCMSRRVASKLADVPASQVEIASEPTEDALMRLLGAPASVDGSGRGRLF